MPRLRDWGASRRGQERIVGRDPFLADMRKYPGSLEKWLTYTDSQLVSMANAKETVGDSDYHSQMARAARQKADATDGPDLARRLREVVTKHERRLRKLRRLGRGNPG